MDHLRRMYAVVLLMTVGLSTTSTGAASGNVRVNTANLLIG